MKTFRLFATLLLVALCTTFVSSCSDEDDGKNPENNLIIGKWKEMTGRNYSEFVEFKSNGTFEYTNTDPENEGYKEVGKYKIQENRLYQMFSDENDWMISDIVKLNSTTLTLEELDSKGEPDGFRVNYERIN